MPKSLADGHTKLTLLTTRPVDPENPTLTELQAGIDAECNILSSDFMWSATDSDKVAEKPLCQENNSNALGASNYQAAITPFRYFDATTKEPSATEDALFDAVKIKGTELWGYARKTAKKATEDWAVGDEIYLGLHAITDAPQAPQEQSGYIKFKVPLEPQEGWEFTEVAPAP